MQYSALPPERLLGNMVTFNADMLFQFHSFGKNMCQNKYINKDKNMSLCCNFL